MSIIGNSRRFADFPASMRFPKSLARARMKISGIYLKTNGCRLAKGGNWHWFLVLRPEPPMLWLLRPLLQSLDDGLVLMITDVFPLRRKGEVNTVPVEFRDASANNLQRAVEHAILFRKALSQHTDS